MSKVAITLSDGRGGRFPNPKGLGFTWPEVQKIGEELDKLKQLQRTNAANQRGQQELIRQLEADNAKVRALAFRGGEAPNEKPLQEAREKLERLKLEDQDLRRAVEMARADYFAAVQAHREEHRADINAKSLKARVRQEEAFAEYRRTQYEVEVLDRLDEFLSEPDIGFNLSPAPQGVNV